MSCKKSNVFKNKDSLLHISEFSKHKSVLEKVDFGLMSKIGKQEQFDTCQRRRAVFNELIEGVGSREKVKSKLSNGWGCRLRSRFLLRLSLIGAMLLGKARYERDPAV